MEMEPNNYPPFLFIVRINRNEQESPKRVRTFKKWLTLEQEMDEPWPKLPSGEDAPDWVSALTIL